MAGALAEKGWRRRARNFLVRQLPCLSAVFPALACVKCCKRAKYSQLGEDDENSTAVEDHRQKFNQTFGLVVTRTAILCAVGITVKLIMTDPGFEPVDVEKARSAAKDGVYGDAVDDFKRDSPLVLYLAVVELLACGACALTASSMYQRRRHQMVHPAESDAKAKQSYLEVHLSKELSTEEMQTFGVGFRPSTDGLECLLIESVRWGSLLDQWNRRQLAPSAEELVEEAFGISPAARDVGDATVVGAAAGSEGASAAAASAHHWPMRRLEQVDIGSAIVAVNDVSGDVGMMQLQLLKPRVTLWIRDILGHASQFEDNLADAVPVGDAPAEARAADRGAADRGGDAAAHDLRSSAASEVIGRPAVSSSASPELEATDAAERGTAPAVHAPAGFPLTIFGLAGLIAPPSKGPCCACVGLEDEEPQILTRWLTCSLLFGWVTMLPVLFMQPHEDRPRQHLFRQFLLKPCLIIMPLWIILWLVDCTQMTIDFKLLHPFFYFLIVHMILPGILVWYLLQMQVADEKLVLDQRAEREKQVDARMLLAVEDPSPTFLKELIMMNPVSLVWLGACISIPVVICSFLTPMTTERGRLAQGFVNIIYSPMIFIQGAFAYTLWHSSFEKLPELYMAGFGLLLSVHCFLIWCVCIVCSSRYGRRDLCLVQEQRLARGKAAKEALQAQTNPGEATEEGADKTKDVDLVDCTEAQNREWELIYTA